MRLEALVTPVQRTERTLCAVAALAAVAAMVCAVAVHRTGLWWSGYSVSSLHALCDTASSLTLVSGQGVVNDCPAAAAAYTLLMAGTVLCALVAVNAAAALVIVRSRGT